MVIRKMKMGSQVMEAIRRANERVSLPEFGRAQDGRRVL